MKVNIVDPHAGNTRQLNLDSSKFLAEGGVGKVWQLGNGEVAKTYIHKNSDNNACRDKLQAMIDNPPDTVKQKINNTEYTLFAWPDKLIEDDGGECIGFVMPELNFGNTISLEPLMVDRPLNNLTPQQNCLNQRFQIAGNISALLADLHKHGHAFIDFKEQNIRLFPDTGIVGFIDCDSYRIKQKNGTVFPGTVISPQITSPDFYKYKTAEKLDEQHDRFVLAILLFRILNYGTHPFQFTPKTDELMRSTNTSTDYFIEKKMYAYGKVERSDIAPTPRSIHKFWDDKTLEMFERAFTSNSLATIPTAREWEAHFRSLIKNKAFEGCSKYPDDVEHINLKGKPCHQCYRTNGAKTKPKITPQLPPQPPKDPDGGDGGALPSPKPINEKWFLFAGVLLAFFVLFIFISNA